MNNEASRPPASGDALREALESIRDAHTPNPEDPHGMGYLEGGGYDRIENVCPICGTADEYAVKHPCWTFTQAEAALAATQPERSGLDVDALIAELSESPLPGARYAVTVVKNWQSRARLSSGGEDTP